MSRFGPNVGDVLSGKYRLIRKIGSGGLGTVFEADHLRLHQKVAIKVLSVTGAREEGLRARFEREGRAMARLKGPHVTRVFDVVSEGDAPYLVMELLSGRDLEQELAARGALPMREAVSLIQQAAEGVAEAHEAGIVHRDLKPSNLFLAASAIGTTVKLLDFGLSKVYDDDGETTAAGITLGTAAYMSPEHVRGLRDVEARSDLWSLGVILFRALSGRLPFNVNGYARAVLSVMNDAPLPLAELVPELPSGLVDVVTRLLQKTPEGRYGSARELMFALAPYCEEDALASDRDDTRLAPSGHHALIDDALIVEPTRGEAHTIPDGVPEAQGAGPSSSTVPSATNAFAASPEPSRSGAWAILLALFVVFLLGGVALFALVNNARPIATEAPTKTAPAAPQVVSAAPSASDAPPSASMNVPLAVDAALVPSVFSVPLTPAPLPTPPRSTTVPAAPRRRATPPASSTPAPDQANLPEFL